MKKGLGLFSLVFFYACSAWAHPTADWLTPRVGVGYGVQVKEGRTSGAELDKMKEAGIDTVRFVIPWAAVEREDGSFSWTAFDPFMKKLRDRGMKAVIVLGGGHPQHTGSMEAPVGNMDQVETYVLAPSKPQDFALFASYAAQTVAHYGTDNIVWELWNEPDSDRFWAPHADVDHYIAASDAACRAIRQTAPEAKIIGPGMADMPGRWGPLRKGFLGAVLKSPLYDCLDAISLHPYRDGEKPPETVLEAHEKLQKFMRFWVPQEKKVLPVITTEWGFTLTDTSEKDQADFLLRSYMLATLAKVPLTIWYEWRDARPGEEDPEAHFGLLTLNKEEKESYKALAAFLPPLRGAKIDQRIKTQRPEDYVLLLTNDEGQHFIVMWTLDETQKVSLVLHNGPKNEPQSYRLTARPQRIDCGATAPTLSVVGG